MTITLTAEELGLIMNKTRNWNAGLVDHVLTNMKLGPDMHVGKDQLDNLKKGYIKNNPEPNWRDLL